ncbi:aldehyde dehydrogenase family protein [Streptomyces sp. NPDC002490]|uniref:aldehyde dehydrogenase family protein n=1 Tax=Streptomyces sp. NPDC002490 TaxID=3154416 RepID=UPI00331650B2
MESHAVRIRDGRLAVDVFPVTGWDRVVLNGHRAEVRMQEGATPESVLAGAAEEYRGGASPPGVALVLGGGNVASVTPLDVLHKLYADGQVVVAKTHPVNAYLRPHLDWVFGEFVRRDWLRFVDGGEAEGAYLTAHPSLDSLDATGSDRTHDAIAWGTDALAERRRREDAPLVTKPFTSELGGVSPAIVLPGDWSDRGFRFQAEHIVTSKLNNSGHNCVASQVLVLPAGWTGSRRLLDEIRLLARALPPRAGYYPGTENRPAEVLARHPEAEILGTTGLVLVPELHDHDDPLITTEVFAGALGMVRLRSDGPHEFLRRAVDFANDVLPGTLSATVLVHPRTEKAAPSTVRDAIAALRYGTVGVNSWPGVGFLLGYTPWDAYPGHTRRAVGSGNRIRAQRLHAGRGREDRARRTRRTGARGLLRRFSVALTSPRVAPGARPWNDSPTSSPHRRPGACRRSPSPRSGADARPSASSPSPAAPAPSSTTADSPRQTPPRPYPTATTRKEHRTMTCQQLQKPRRASKLLRRSGLDRRQSGHDLRPGASPGLMVCHARPATSAGTRVDVWSVVRAGREPCGLVRDRRTRVGRARCTASPRKAPATAGR